MTPQHLVAVRHNFETAHRLPHIGGKCRSLHGHSWWAEVTLAGPKRRDGTVIEFGQVKRHIRQWIDAQLDHGAMLGVGDPLVDALKADGSKLYRFGMPDHTSTFPPERIASGLHWPTVENVAELLARVATNLAIAQPAAGITVHAVRVTETHVNAAECRP